MTPNEEPFGPEAQTRIRAVAAATPDQAREWWQSLRLQRRALTLGDLLRARRGRGRPPGIRDVTKEKLVATYRAMERDAGSRPTQKELGRRLSANERQIRDWLSAYGLSWPIE
jgi:hypothetical protein